MNGQLAATSQQPVRSVSVAPGQPLLDADIFLDNLDALAEVAGGVAGLRRLVLDLAVRGRLTSLGAAQADATDGPFSIPPDWLWARGREVFGFVTSGSRGWAAHYADAGPIFLRIGNLDYESIELDLSEIQHVRPPANAEGTRTRVEAGDILISITGDTGMVGLVPDGFGEAYINQHIALARPSARIVPGFMARALTAPSLLGRLQERQRGIKNSLGLDDIRDMRLPIPPLAEQKRIVAKVDQLMGLIDELEASQTKKHEVQSQFRTSALDALTRAEEPEELASAWKRVAGNFGVLFSGSGGIEGLREAILDLALHARLSERAPGDGAASALLSQLAKERIQHGPRAGKPPTTESQAPFPIPDSWSWATLARLWASITDGDHQPPPKQPSGVPFLTIGNISSGKLDFSATRYVSPAYIASLDAARVPREGDLLYTVVGSFGIPVVVDTHQQFCVQRHIAILRPLPSTNVGWMYYWLRSGFLLRQAQAAATGIAQPTVGLGSLRSFVVPVPPLAEQKRIVAKIETLMKLCDDLEAKLKAKEQTAGKLVEAVAKEIVAPAGRTELGP